VGSKPVEEFPQTSGNLTAASQNLYDLIEGGNLVLYPDANMRLAASRAVAVETSRGWRISKEKQSHKIDVIVALAMACHAAVQGSSEPYFDRSFAGFQDDFVDLDRRGGDAPDDTAGKSSSNYAVQQMKAFIATGGLIGEGPIAIGGRWR
jgi:hypothetical protein